MPIDDKVKRIIRDMESWFADNILAKSVAGRSHDQRVWDSAILAASEFIRRYTDYDEHTAGQIHGLLSTKLPRATAGEQGEAGE